MTELDRLIAHARRLQIISNVLAVIAIIAAVIAVVAAIYSK